MTTRPSILLAFGAIILVGGFLHVYTAIAASNLNAAKPEEDISIPALWGQAIGQKLYAPSSGIQNTSQKNQSSPTGETKKTSWGREIGQKLHASPSEIENISQKKQSPPTGKTERKNFIFFRDDANHSHVLPSNCIQDVTPVLFDQWRKGNKTECTHMDMSLQTYTMQRWEYAPTFRVYKNFHLDTFYPPSFNVTAGQPGYCEDLIRMYNKSKDGNLSAASSSAPTTTTIGSIDHPVIRVTPYCPTNAYERFHAYLNVAMAIAMFNVSNPQIVYVHTEKAAKGTGGFPENDFDMYRSFSSLEPITVSSPNATQNIFVPYMIDSMASATSILVSKTGGALRGRGRDHHCKSSIVRGILRWMKSNILHGGDGNDSDQQNDNGNATETIQIIWSSRQPYRHPSKGVHFAPKRSIGGEDELIRQVGQALGSEYNITLVNFGTLSTQDSVKIASQSNIMVGVHGAGLTWSVFLKSVTHSGLVEIFGGDRDSSNRHYHNIASLADIHYRSMNLPSLKWDERTVREAAWQIRSIDLNQEPGVNEPRYSGGRL